MRVLFLSDVYFPRVNGVSTSIRTFRADLSAAGVDSVLVAPSYGDEAHDDSASIGESGIVRVTSSRVPGDPEDRRMQAGALRRALASLADEHFDLVHIHTPFMAHYAGIRFARRRGVPVLATYHTFFEEYLHHYVPVLPRAIGRVLARGFTRSQCAQLAAILAPSEPMRDLLLGYGVRTRIEVIPTGLPADRYVQGDGQRFRVAHNIPTDRPLLLYVGRVAHEKNIDFLLQVFVELRRTHADVLFAIAGEGPALQHLRGLVTGLGLSGSVHFIGYLERQRELVDCYAAGDIFIFASRTETQGLVLLEALAQGRPVVSTAYLGTASILKAGCGARVSPEKIECFARAIADILEDPTRAAALRDQARAYAQTWASSRTATRLAALYGELAGTAAPAATAA